MHDQEGEPDKSPQMPAEMYDEKETQQEDQLHICRGYVVPEELPINGETIKRAEKAGVIEPLLSIFDPFVDYLEHSCSTENTYDDLAGITDSFVKYAVLILDIYRAPNVEIDRFRTTSDSEVIIYLSQMHRGIIVVEIEENGNSTVNMTTSKEIWRYLHSPNKIVQTIISTLIAVAEKHQNIKDEWLSSSQKVRDLSRIIRNRN